MPDTGKPSRDAESVDTAAERIPDTLSLILDDIHLEGVVLRELDLAAPWALRLHTPGLTAVHIVIRGHALLTRTGAEPVTIDTGDVVILPGGTAHTLRDAGATPNTEPRDLLPELSRLQPAPLRVGGDGESAALLSGHFRFDVDMARPLVKALPPFMQLRGIGGSAPAWLEHGLRFIAVETARALPGQQAIFNHVADILLVETLRDYVESLPEGAGNWLLALRDRSLSAALAALHQDPAHDWTVPELADTAHLSRSAFADRFTQVMGQPPLSYLTEHRMRLAARMLTHTRLTIARIAERVGYGSETAFSQAFKRQYGTPPSRARCAGT